MRNRSESFTRQKTLLLIYLQNKTQKQSQVTRTFLACISPALSCWYQHCPLTAVDMNMPRWSITDHCCYSWHQLIYSCTSKPSFGQFSTEWTVSCWCWFIITCYFSSCQHWFQILEFQYFTFSLLSSSTCYGPRSKRFPQLIILEYFSTTTKSTARVTQKTFVSTLTRCKKGQERDAQLPAQKRLHSVNIGFSVAFPVATRRANKAG